MYSLLDMQFKKEIPLVPLVVRSVSQTSRERKTFRVVSLKVLPAPTVAPAKRAKRSLNMFSTCVSPRFVSGYGARVRIVFNSRQRYRMTVPPLYKTIFHEGVNSKMYSQQAHTPRANRTFRGGFEHVIESDE